MAESTPKQILAVSLKKLEYAAIPEDGGVGTEYKDIPVIHDGTFTYEEADGEETKYINQLTGKPYYVSTKPGDVKVNFSIGQYDLETKSVFQGGTYKAAAAGAPASWERPVTAPQIEYTFRATTQDDVVIVIPRGQVAAKTAANEKALGISLAVTAMQPRKKGVASEMWLDAPTQVSTPA